MHKPDFTYEIDHSEKVVRIVDLNRGNMSVTNGAEYVLDEIVNREPDYDIRMYKFIYKDSEGQWDTIIPHWSNGKCLLVSFKFGV